MSRFSCAMHVVFPVLLLMQLVVPAQAKQETLANLKSAYIYNIAKFTSWPESQSSSDMTSINFCLYGSNEVIELLQGIEGKAIGKRLSRVIMPREVSDFKRCHVLYIAPEERKRYRYILSLIDQNQVITISDDERFIKSGGLINLTEIGQRLRFQINVGLLETQELHISSHLLKLAILVDE